MGKTPHPTREPVAVDISVVVPMFNEADNLPGILLQIAGALEPLGRSFEVIAVNDGSTDNTEEILREARLLHPWVKPVFYRPNRGRGFAQRRGFAEASGKFILTTDADLSYHPSHLAGIVQMLDAMPDVDFVVGSPYMPGGSTKNVPAGRLMLSRLGNWVLGVAMPGGIKTVTGILRGYRREVLDSLDLESDGKEINLEIVSKAVAAGFRACEMPAVLTGRKKGKSKFLLKATVISHLLFSFFERPAMLFGAIGALLFALGLIGGGHLIYLWQMGNLNPDRPLMTLVVILLVAGLQISLFGFLGTQLVRIHRELFRIQRENKQLARRLSQVTGPVERQSGRLYAHIWPEAGQQP
jgi:glycosyltransferase involved in cell wall biosynthesis